MCHIKLTTCGPFYWPGDIYHLSFTLTECKRDCLRKAQGLDSKGEVYDTIWNHDKNCANEYTWEGREPEAPWMNDASNYKRLPDRPVPHRVWVGWKEATDCDFCNNFLKQCQLGTGATLPSEWIEQAKRSGRPQFFVRKDVIPQVLQLEEWDGDVENCNWTDWITKPIDAYQNYETKKTSTTTLEDPKRAKEAAH